MIRPLLTIAATTVLERLAPAPKPVAPRWTVRDLPPLDPCVLWAYPAQPCPNCQRLAAWVGVTLVCVSCGARHCVDRTVLRRVRERGVYCFDAFERLLGSGREGSRWVL
jgi:hypothetical protein